MGIWGKIKKTVKGVGKTVKGTRGTGPDRQALLDAEAVRNGLNDRQRAIFDQYYIRPNVADLKDASYTWRAQNINDAIKLMNTRIKKGNIMAAQLAKRGNPKEQSSKAKLKISEASRGTITKSTASGKYSSSKGLNALKISAGVQL